MREKIPKLTKILTGLSGLALIISLSGCRTGNVNVPDRYRPAIDLHSSNGEPITGAIPWAASLGEEHHSYNPSSTPDYGGIVLFRY
jgi:hypothetical protein